MKKILSLFTNPYSGPILIISFIVFFIIFYVFPKYSEETKLELMSNKAIELANDLKDLRHYYTKNVISKIENNKNIKINSDYNNSNTIPLPATFLHDLSELYSKKNIKFKLYSDYPFPNRKDRILSEYEKNSLKFLINNPDKIYKEVIKKNNKMSIEVAIADVFYEQACVNCHNTRADTPKNDWKKGDVRGAISIIVNYDDLNEISLSPTQTMKIISALVLLILILIIHYTIFFIRRSNQYEENKLDFEKGLANRTEELHNTMNLLDQYKYAVDKSAIVSKADKNGKITYVNDEFIRISKYSKEELIGQNHNIIKFKDEEKSIFKNLWKTITEKKVWKGIIKNSAKDGSTYYVSSTIIPILDSKHEIQEYLAVRYDITDAIESKLKAQKADESKSIFLANMSHEIRTPLNAIIGFSDVLSNSKELNPQNIKQADIINTSANSLLEIINDILDVSKIESGNFSISLDKTDLYSLCEHIIELFSNKALEKNIKLICNIDTNIPLEVITDKVRLRQVISNILSNAIKFTPLQGEVKLNVILIKENKKTSTIRFEVLDSGIGIQKDKLTMIFDPFIQVDHKSNRKFEGTGLGLSICSHIIKALKSTINVESVLKQGSKFWFDLDLQSNNRQIESKKYSFNNINFKVTDIEDNTFKYIKNYLKTYGTINENNKEFDLIVYSYIDEEMLNKTRELYKSKLLLVLFDDENNIRNIQSRLTEEFISLPFYPSKVNDSLQNLLNKNKKDTRLNLQKEAQFKYDLKVLVAEDNKANQELIKYILEAHGVNFIVKNNGLDAFNTFKLDSYDLILTDINMPIMDGIDLLKNIREYEKKNNQKKTPIVAITANSLKDDKQKYLELGMDYYLSKPINNNELKDILKKQIFSKKIISNNLEEEVKTYFDIQKISNKLGVSENIAELIINKFKKEIHSDLNELENYIKINDNSNIIKKAHYIKNSALNVCLDKICSLLEKLEDNENLENEKKIFFKEIKNKLNNI